MLWDEGRNDPLSFWAHGHVRSCRHSTDQRDGGYLVLVLLQDLTVEVDREQLWPWAHSNQMPADVVMGADCYIWEGETTSECIVARKQRVTTQAASSTPKEGIELRKRAFPPELQEQLKD